MIPPDFTYMLHNASGTPSVRLDIHYRQALSRPNAAPAQAAETYAPALAELKVHLENSIPLWQREESLGEYQKLADVLGLSTRLDEKKTTLAINVAEKSPEALMMFIAGDLEKRALVDKAQAREFTAAVLSRGDATPQPSVISSSMHSALQSAHSQSAGAGLHGAGVQHPVKPNIPEYRAAVLPKPPAKHNAQIV